MKLRLNYCDMDLVVRFGISCVIVLNIINIYVLVFYEIFFDGVFKEVGMFS